MEHAGRKYLFWVSGWGLSLWSGKWRYWTGKVSVMGPWDKTAVEEFASQKADCWLIS